jgi:hypothetical protein
MANPTMQTYDHVVAISSLAVLHQDPLSIRDEEVGTG